MGRTENTVAFVPSRMPRLIGLSTRAFLRPAVLLPFVAVAAIVWFTTLGEQDIDYPWSEYLVYVIGAAVIVTLQASMIAALLEQRSRRRRAEADLRESEARFRSMADVVPILIWVANADGNVTFLNKGWQDFVGDSAQGTLLDTWTSCVHPDDLPNCLAAQAQHVASRANFVTECRLRRCTGEYRWMRCAGTPRFSLAGQFLGYIGSCNDVSTLREADAERQTQRETLAHVGRVATMGELTASLVHELNQPLAAILTNAEAGERLLGRNAPPLDKVRQILADIRADDKRAAEIIRGVRGFLRRHEIAKSTIDLNETVEEIVRLMRREAIERGVEMRFARLEKSVCVSGNRVQLQQVVMNLVLNGLEAMSAVPADERRITLQVYGTADGAATMVVADRGPGVPADKLSRLFEPFYTTKKDGLGMGLSIARSITEAHGGRIWAANNPDAGATFCVTLPGALCSPRAV